MTNDDYKFIAKELAKRHDTIKSILDTADENYIITRNKATTLFKQYFIAVGEFEETDTGMHYTFDIRHFRIQPKENSSLSLLELPKTIDGLKLSDLLYDGEDIEKNPFYWYDQWKSGKTYHAIVRDLKLPANRSHIVNKIKSLDKAIKALRYRELVT